jgi:hypothetical protein
VDGLRESTQSFALGEVRVLLVPNQCFLYRLTMQMVSYIDRRDFHLLSENEGYWKKDSKPVEIRRFLESIGIHYVTPFVCFGVLPDGVNPNDTRNRLHVFGDTPVILRTEIADEVKLACLEDLQTTAVNGLKAGGSSGKIPAQYKQMILDLRKSSVSDRGALLKKLCSQFDAITYVEVRIYRTITWKDVEENCRKRLQSQGDNQADVLLGPDFP